jgi:hypothetical protein
MSAKGHGETGVEGISLIRSLARIPDFVRHPEIHLAEIRSSYPRLRTQCQMVDLRLAKMTELISSGKVQVDQPMLKVYAHCQTAYSFVLSLSSILNGILRAFEPYDISLAEDSATFVDEIIILAERASQFRPLGASHVSLSLMIAWAATDDLSQKCDLERLIAAYQTDLAESGLLDGAVWLKARYQRQQLKSLRTFPKNTLESCNIGGYAIIRESEAALHPKDSCDVQ